ncbi:hypothetical protein EKN06_08885 [Croceicoccus ponticola]|uniref:Uncharacterized protein n=1 Tax=Croceicoccus ponticola TaxID=2217664 RepID=A0A437GXE5_9SPHN|nr:hypothetical protein [Croceicoccus ponticola]RVQ67039.1 hypothetical protein EKN06_08885 [Croceicoccus ponticola]
MTGTKFGLAGRRAWIWAIAFTGGALLIAWAEQAGVIAPPWNWLAIFVVALTIIPLARATSNRQRACGSLSPAMQRYNNRTLAWALAYVAGVAIAVIARDRLEPEGPLLWAIAILPALPILYMIWTMGRYLVEETDEYQKMRQVQAALAGLGVLLAVATFVGFLQTFANIPATAAWWAVPVWAIGMGLYQLFRALTERAEVER